jgi:hypothetical protein
MFCQASPGGSLCTLMEGQWKATPPMYKSSDDAGTSHTGALDIVCVKVFIVYCV